MVQTFQSAEISHLVEEAFPTYGHNAEDVEKFRCLIARIEPYLQLRYHEHGVTTLESALKGPILYCFSSISHSC